MHDRYIYNVCIKKRFLWLKRVPDKLAMWSACITCLEPTASKNEVHIAQFYLYLLFRTYEQQRAQDTFSNGYQALSAFARQVIDLHSALRPLVHGYRLASQNSNGPKKKRPRTNSSA